MNPSRRTRENRAQAETGDILKSDIEALLNLRLRNLALPPDLLARYNARTATTNRKIMANWCARVGGLSLLIGALDPFAVPPALLPGFIICRLLISLAFWLCSAAITSKKFAGREYSLIIIPCTVMMILAGTGGIIAHRDDLLFVNLTVGVVIIYTAIMVLRLRLRDAQLLGYLSVAVMGISLLASGGGHAPEKLQIFGFFSVVMVVLTQARRIQNLYQQRMFLMNLRDEMSHSEVSALNEQLSNIAYTDQLTGLPNRRYFDEICASMSDETINLFPLSLCMADIDHFKTLNDNLGHLQGDRCLRLVATVIRQNLRGKRDILARYGGEEFVIVLPGAAASTARLIVERIRAAIETLAHPNPGSPFGIVTASFGVATTEAQPLSIQALIADADNALYRAKSAGRNTVTA